MHKIWKNQEYASEFFVEKPRSREENITWKNTKNLKRCERKPPNSNSNPMVAQKVHYENIHQIHYHITRLNTTPRIFVQYPTALQINVWHIGTESGIFFPILFFKVFWIILVFKLKFLRLKNSWNHWLIKIQILLLKNSAPMCEREKLHWSWDQNQVRLYWL